MLDARERLRRLKSMLEQTSPQGTIESVVAEREARAEGLESRGGRDESAADTALRKLATRREDDITQQEIQGLEAIVMPQNRPVVFVRGTPATYDDLPAPGQWTHLNAPPVRERIAGRLTSIGRIELPNSPSIPYGGTAFLVGPNLLMTNRHVARQFADGLGLGSRITYRTGDAAIDFTRQVDTDGAAGSAHLVIASVEMIHPYWDMALLRVENVPDGIRPLTLSVRPTAELLERDVVVVGYPARDDRNDLALQDRIFDRVYNVKRLQPGKLRPHASIRSFDNIVSAITHDSSTLGGNSGSAIIDVETGEVVALHFAGEYLKANYAVATYDLARDRRVAAARVNFSGSAPVTNDWEPAWMRVEAGERPTPAPPASPASPSVNVTGAGIGVTFTIPLNITVSLGGAVPGAAAAIALPGIAAIEAPRMQVPVIFGGLENRKGYSPAFLDLDDDEVPKPELTAIGKTAVARMDDGDEEIRYHKFSVVMHKGRRMALYTASNVDWRPVTRKIDGAKPTRRELTGLAEGQQEKWVTDWRIPEKHQLPDVFYTKDGGAFDKGHLVRRDDVCWGRTFKDIQKANGDTYHTPNCSPQVSGFNRGAGGDENWGDLETLIQRETRAEKAIIFAGPAFAEDDRLFEGRGEEGSLLIRIPRAYWKIVVVKGNAGPEAYGFVLEQDLSNVPLREEFAVPAAWRRYMKSIEEIEGLLNGLVTLSWLKGHDRFASEEGVRVSAQLA
jgi:endonuclease G